MVVRGIVVAVALALLASGCTGDDPEPRARALEAPPTLKAAWTADLTTAAPAVPHDSLTTFRSTGDVDLWQVGDTVVLVGRGGLQAFDAATGAPAWTLAVPPELGTVCATSENVGPTGLAGLLFASRRTCDAAGVVDLTTGHLRWTAPLPQGSLPLDPENADHPLRVGARTLTVEVLCDEVRRYDLATGRRLPEPFHERQGCLHTVALGDGVTAIASGSEVSLYDEASGRRLWRTSLGRGYVEVERVVSTDPLVLEVDQDGHRAYRRFDRQGRPGAFVGRQADRSPMLLGVLGGTAVVGYSAGALSNPVVRAFDLQTGEQRWRTSTDRAPAGEQAGRILTLAHARGPSDDGPRVWVGRFDPARPEHEAALGSIPFDPLARYGWTDDGVLVRQVDDHVEVYALPDPATDDDAPAMPRNPSLPAEPRWGDDDVRPSQVADLCTAVRPVSLRALGFRSTRFPTPAGCDWHDVRDDPRIDRVLQVSAYAVAPRGSRSADDEAHRSLVEQMAPTEDGQGLGPAAPLPDLGDEALVARRRGREGAQSRVAVRVGNVVLVVHSVENRRGEAPATGLAALLAGQRRVLADLLAALDDLPPADRS